MYLSVWVIGFSVEFFVVGEFGVNCMWVVFFVCVLNGCCCCNNNRWKLFWDDDVVVVDGIGWDVLCL